MQVQQFELRGGLSDTSMQDDATSPQGYLEAFDELDDPCNSQQSKQLLNAEQLTDLHSQGAR